MGKYKKKGSSIRLVESRKRWNKGNEWRRRARMQRECGTGVTTVVTHERDGRGESEKRDAMVWSKMWPSREIAALTERGSARRAVIAGLCAEHG